METRELVELIIYFVAIMNPVSKVMFLATYEPELTQKQTVELTWKSSVAALLMLATFAVIGDVLLNHVFHIEMYSLQVTGGLVVFAIGWLAIREGRFFQKRERDMRQDYTELSIVPLAAPLIAGPGTISIAISFSGLYGSLTCLFIMTIAILLNLIFMIFALPVHRVLNKLHLNGPLIRITGLIVAAVAVQMIFSGITAWIATLHPTT